MELTSPKSLRNQYIQTLSESDEYTDILKVLINKKDNAPIFTTKELNYEEAPSFNNEQRELLEIALDINSINNGIFEMKSKVSELIEYIDSNVSSIKSSIKKEDERISDINIICGQDSEYNMVVPIYSSDFTEQDTDFEVVDDKYIGAKLKTQEEVAYTITSISGNGLAGNRFVYNNNVFENEENDYSNQEYISDDSDITKYEYSRLFTNAKEEVIDGIVNYDNKDVEMTIVLGSTDNQFNKIKWLSENEDLVVKKLETSSDGIEFTSRLSKEIKNGEAEIVYNDSTYIYGSDILCFPYCYYVRITFSSSNIENDKIAIIDEDDNIVEYPNTRRKKIAINNIKLYRSTYEDATICSGNIITGGSVDKAALFLSEYIPEHFTDTTYFTYYLVINGEEYEVVPVNFGKSGTKVIKFSEADTSPDIDSWITTTQETIKSIQIKIAISTPNSNETPYIGNIKLCLEKETGSIYV